jgi:hypothetical protein
MYPNIWVLQHEIPTLFYSYVSAFNELNQDRLKRVLTVVYNTQNHWISRQHPSSGIINICVGNWIFFHPEVKGKRHRLSWVPWKEFTSITVEKQEYFKKYTLELSQRDYSNLLHPY